MLRTVIAVFVATLAGAVGQVLMRRGMQVVGSLESYMPLEVLAYFWKALCQPYVIAGTALSAVFYFCILAALSWTEVTVTIPLTALEYGFTAVLAVTILKEAVPPLRWAGIAFVVLGVILITAGGERAAPAAKASIHRSKGSIYFDSH